MTEAKQKLSALMVIVALAVLVVGIDMMQQKTAADIEYPYQRGASCTYIEDSVLAGTATQEQEDAYLSSC